MLCLPRKSAPPSSRLFQLLLRSALLCLLAGTTIWNSSVASAQEFRVLTVIYDASNSDDTPVASSLTLFHAGKAYDYIDAIGELIISEPVHNRFTLFNIRGGMATTAEFDQIMQMQSVARKAIEDHLQEIEQTQGSATDKLAQQLRFQLEPRFHETYDPGRKMLSLSSPFALYDVLCADDRQPEIVEAYLQYADWMCRLNYVLHPQSMPPEVRLRLNERLREHGLFPVQVRLQSAIAPARDLRAEHRIRWELVGNDRDLIHEWELRLGRESTRRVTLREYQQAILGGQTAKR